MALKRYAVATWFLVSVLAGCKTTESLGPSAGSPRSKLSGDDSNGKSNEIECVFGASRQPGLPENVRQDRIDREFIRIVTSHALAANVAYQEDAAIKAQAAEWGYPSVEVMHAGTMSAFVMSNSKCVVLAFRGTDPFSSDWLVDLNAEREWSGRGYMHAGFREGWMSLADQVRDAVARHDAAHKVFWVTGHSLGGALAGIYAYFGQFGEKIRPTFFSRLRTVYGPRIDTVVTFGQPLFADLDLARAMRIEFLGRYFRVVNETDLFASVPFWFTHFGSLLWMHENALEFSIDKLLTSGPDGKASVDPAAIPPELAATREATEALREVIRQGSGRDRVPTYGSDWAKRIADHSMDFYVDRLKIELRRP